MGDPRLSGVLECPRTGEVAAAVEIEDRDDAGQSPYREALSRWPDEWRERWGERANALQEQGLSWRDAEVRAFIEVWNRRRVGQPLRLELAEALGTR